MIVINGLLNQQGFFREWSIQWFALNDYWVHLLNDTILVINSSKLALNGKMSLPFWSLIVLYSYPRLEAHVSDSLSASNLYLTDMNPSIHRIVNRIWFVSFPFLAYCVKGWYVQSSFSIHLKIIIYLSIFEYSLERVHIHCLHIYDNESIDNWFQML